MFRQTPMILPGPEVAPDNSQTLDIMGRLSQQIGVNLKQRADTKKAQELASILVNGSPEQKQDAQIQIGAMQAQDQLNQRTQAARQQNKIQSNMQRIMSDDTTRNALIKLQQLNPQMASTLVGAMVQEDQAAQAEIAALSKKAQNFYTNAISFAVDESRGGIESAKKFVFDKRQELQRQGQPTNILDNMLSQQGDEFIASLYRAQAEAGAVNEIPSLQQAFENSIAERETSVKEQNANTASGRLSFDRGQSNEENQLDSRRLDLEERKQSLLESQPAKPSKQEQQAIEIDRKYNAFDVAMTAVEEAFSKTNTGPISGRLRSAGRDNRKAKAAAALLQPALKDMFRSAGEGTFTDSDQKILLDLAPTIYDDDDVARFKMQKIREIVSAKLGVGNTTENDPLGLR